MKNNYNKLSPKDLSELAQLVGEQRLFTDPSISKVIHMTSLRYQSVFMPQVVVRPTDTRMFIAKILMFANERKYR